MKNDAKTLIILSPGFPKDESDTACLPSQQIFVRALNKNFPSLRIFFLRCLEATAFTERGIF